MAVEPPLVKGVINKGSDRSIVIGEGLLRDVESIHARMEDRCNRSLINEETKKEKTLTNMGLHVSSRNKGKKRKERESEHVRDR